MVGGERRKEVCIKTRGEWSTSYFIYPEVTQKQVGESDGEMESTRRSTVRLNRVGGGSRSESGGEDN